MGWEGDISASHHPTNNVKALKGGKMQKLDRTHCISVAHQQQIPKIPVRRARMLDTDIKFLSVRGIESKRMYTSATFSSHLTSS